MSFAFMLKSYAPHLEFAIKLLNSIVKFNVDSIHTYIVVPSQDARLFESLDYPNISILIEEDLPVKLATEDVSGIRAGYVNQEIIKLAFHRLNLAEHYLCLDSDGEFLRQFTLSDFITSSGQPYTVLVEDNELQVDSDYYARYWIDRKESQSNILRFLNMDVKEIWLNCHNFQIFSTEILRLFDRDVLNLHDYDYIDLMKISPYEFSWYNYFLQSLNIPIRVREPFFKVFHTENQLATARLTNLDYEKISRGYLGICIQSNFLGNNGAISLEENIFVTHSRFLNYRELLKVTINKISNDLRRPKILIYRILTSLGLGSLLRIVSKVKKSIKAP